MKAGQASSTAHLIARSLLLLSAHEEEYRLHPRTERVLRQFAGAFAGGRDRLVEWMTHPWFRRLLLATQRSVLDGLFEHYARRKRRIATIVREACQSGAIRRMVVIGAGFDTLTLELGRELRGLHLVEVDHPATQAVKRAGLELAGERELAERIDFVAVDLAATGGELPPLPGGPAQPTVFVAEGLMMYLAADDVQRLLGSIVASAAAARVVFTFLETGRAGQPNFYRDSRLVEAYLRWKGEPFRWGISSEELPAFTGAAGLETRAIVHPAGPEESEIRELLCVADARWPR